MRKEKAKTILSSTRNVNLYRGCSHNCIYCDARSECYQIHDFENIIVKENAIEILRKELSKKRSRFLIYTGAMCDPYLHIEEEVKLTQQMLELIYEFHFGIVILTKSTLVLRDLEILKKINQRYKAIVSMTITTIDDKLCQKIEPNVSITSKRLECLEIFANAGILTGVWLCPVLPFLTDSIQNIVGIVEACAKVKVKYILCFGFGTTMRKGSREYFYQQLDRHFPKMKYAYMKKYDQAYSCLSPQYQVLKEAFINECKKYHILYDAKEIFKYLEEYKEVKQLSLFD